MEKWRDRGYVPDSDEEETQQSRDSYHLAVGATGEELLDVIEDTSGQGDEHGGGLNCADLEQEQFLSSLGKDLDGDVQKRDQDIDELALDYDALPSAQLPSKIQEISCGWVHGVQQDSSPTTVHDVFDGLPSSPLTELPLTPRAKFDSTNPILLSESIAPVSQTRPVSEETIFSTPYVTAGQSTRAFRRRNPIQLHPYAIESERYRKSLKARGVQPLRIARVHSDECGEEDNESQAHTFQPQEDRQRNDYGSLSQDVISSSPPRAQHSSPFPFHESTSSNHGDDLPDVSNLLRRVPGTALRGSKRRKLQQTFSLQRQSLLPELSISPPRETYSVARLGGFLGPQTEDDFAVPPSPPLSGSPKHLPALPEARGFRVPPGVSPAPLRTPVTSSDIKTRPAPTARNLLREYDSGEELEQSLEENIVRPRRPARSPIADLLSSESEDNEQRHLVQRKIKGVLPASWLRLDLRTKDKEQQNRHRESKSASPRRRVEERGVARPVVKSRRRKGESGTLARALADLRDESSPERRSPSKPMIISLSSGGEESISVTADHEFMEITRNTAGDALEDNRIDAMLPKRTRPLQKRRTNTQKTAKERAHHAFRVQKNTSLFQTAHSERHYQPTVSDHLPGRQRRESKRYAPPFRPPDLSILDAPSDPEVSAVPVPQFLRIAARTVRSKPNGGRHSPSKKFLRLATEEDSRESLKTLRDWKEGVLQAKRVAVVRRHHQSRLPLKSVSGNGRSEQLNRRGTSSLAEIVDDTRSVGYRVNNRKSKQRSLETFLATGSAEIRPTPSTSRKVVRSNLRGSGKASSGHLVSSLHRNNASRSAVLETLEHEGNYHQPRHGSTSVYKALPADVSTTGAPGLQNPLLERYLQSENGVEQEVNSRSEDNPTVRSAAQEIQPKPRRRQKRKHVPTRIDTNGPQFKEKTRAIMIDDDLIDESNEQVSSLDDELLLTGLGCYGTEYPIEFGVAPLPLGTHLPESSFVGCGQLLKSLKCVSFCELDDFRGAATFHLNENTLEWGAWNQTVSSELSILFGCIGECLQSAKEDSISTSVYLRSGERSKSLLDDLIWYCNSNLSFLDPVDRISFLRKCTLAASILHNDINIIFRAVSLSQKAQYPERIAPYNHIAFRLLVFVFQLHKIAEHPIVESDLKSELRLLLVASQRQCVAAIEALLDNPPDRLYSLHGGAANSAREILDPYGAVECLDVVSHIAKCTQMPPVTFWEMLETSFRHKRSTIAIDISVLEQAWRKLFNILPHAKLNSRGMVDGGCNECGESWSLIKHLTAEVLEANSSDPQKRHPSYNAYCRALLGRCLKLINIWDWRRCEQIIGFLFDFFARNHLAHLRNERCHGSPTFMENLDTELPDYEPGDLCFHIFLKIVGFGLRSMNKSQKDQKKIRDIAWRLIPNHGRYNPKDKAIQECDLNSLRNHHDLLCILYWASPPGFRPGLSLIRNLVDLESSHRSACHINIRAWSNLVRFQLSTSESTSSLEPFAEWHSDLLGQIMKQHRQARTEAELQARDLESESTRIIPRFLFESTIATNERQVEAVLMDALVSLGNALNAARDTDAARRLLTRSLTEVFSLFNSKQPRINKIISEVLNILCVYTSRCLKKGTISSLDTENDSQDYGDWTAITGAYDEESPEHIASVHLQTMAFGPLERQLSNALGSDVVPEDKFLEILVDTWVTVVHLLISHNLRTWVDFLEPHGQASWNSFRDTEQTRKLSPYFMTLVIEKDPTSYQEHRDAFLMAWLASLVERESALKFQHKYTAALLGCGTGDPLMENFPFWIDPVTKRYDMTIKDFSDRRLLVIECLLSNMRESLDFNSYHQLGDASALQHSYSELLRHMMGAMKRNYQELGNASNTRGTYVDFVQKVIGLLQKHTVNICPIDRFFTDSTAFPLPSTDPTYAVGRLRNYALRLTDARVPKQICYFTQTLCERAAVDGQQIYLTGQLYEAMAEDFEAGDPEKPTLRSFLIQAIFPAYIELAFETRCGWLLALSILEALQQTYSTLLQHVDGSDCKSLESTLTMSTTLLLSIHSGFRLMCANPTMLDSSHTKRMASSCLTLLATMVPVIEYLVRIYRQPNVTSQFITLISQIMGLIGSISCHDERADQPDVEDQPHLDFLTLPRKTQIITTTRSYARDELKENLIKHWSCHEGTYYVSRGNSRRAITVQLGSSEEEHAILLAHFKHFRQICDEMFATSWPVEQHLPESDDEKSRSRRIPDLTIF
ncbi:hypothetical protein MMC09_003666 [Bachmanniomyces sp. S44760]|nr:hypothetical protein [Bachmanniomyces sp. S44760]